MKRWNGWGDEEVTYPISASAKSFLQRVAGIGHRTQDIGLDAAVANVPKSHLRRHPLISTDPLLRLQHARGQSFPDWLALRSGQINSYPDGVAFPMSDQEVAQLVQYAQRSGIHLIPYGGGTSVCGHINPMKTKTPILTVDMSRMNHLIELDSKNLLATFETGILGPDLEAHLRAGGFTLGHYPQSFEYSSLGGWVSTRSSGQQSLGYGRIEKLFAGGSIETPLGQLVMPPFPASAAGPDLREFVLGSEGRLGILTRTCVRIRPIPELEEFHAVFFADFLQGIDAIRQILSAGLNLCMLRLSTANETATTLAFAGHENLIGALERLLALRGMGKNKCLLLLGFNGKSALVQITRREALSITARCGGVYVGKTFGAQWHKSRFSTPYLRNTLWELGYGIDALETAIDWVKVPQMVKRIETAIHDTSSAFDEKIHIFTHLSHVYPTGSSVYTSYVFRLFADPEKTLTYWSAIKTAVNQAITSLGGTISHHHGVGLDHKAYLVVEKGALGVAAISAVCHAFDPKGIMNPGKMVN